MLRLFTLIITAIASIAFSAVPVLAQVDAGLNEVGGVIPLTAEDPRTIIVRLINISLGLIGIILVSLIVYAGFLWMTSGGASEKTEQAKKILRNSIIGLVIIVSSWAITRFVIERLLDATGNNGGGTTTNNGGSGNGGLGGAGGLGGFQITSIQPNGDLSIRNIVVRVQFTQEVDASLVASQIRVTEDGGGAVAGAWEVMGSETLFTPSAACPGVEGRFCFDGNKNYTITVGGGMRSASGQRIACGGLAPVCEGRFRTGDRIDTDAPSTVITQPFDGQSVSVDALIPVAAIASDDSGIASVRFLADNRELVTVAPPVGQTPLSFQANGTWRTHGVSLGEHTVQASSQDIANNRQTSEPPVRVMVRAAHCFNNERDADELDIDCGGSCGACLGSVCTQNNQCAQGVCQAGRCVERPIITQVSPDNGRGGTFVTIRGSNFGDAPGTVRFHDGKTASFPVQCQEGTNWSDTEIIVTVPMDATDGPVEVRNALSGLNDRTNDDFGPRLGSFDVNEIAHPGLCALQPSAGLSGSRVMFNGVGFGSTANSVFFEQDRVTAFSLWQDDQIETRVPTREAGPALARVRVGNADSNPVTYRVQAEAPQAAPVIDSITPAAGPVGEYITIRGRNFGNTAGNVRVRTGDGRITGLADTDFPAVCDVSGQYWTDTVITFKVPASLRGDGIEQVVVIPGAYEVSVDRGTPQTMSNRMGLTVESGVPGPGICALSPSAGPVSTELVIAGERLTDTQGQVFFQGEDGEIEAGQSNVVSWGDTEVRVTVPNEARTGQVTVQASQQRSNPRVFTVQNCNENAAICSATQRCCPTGECVAQSGGRCRDVSVEAHFAWRFSTGEIPLYPEVIEECNVAGRVLSSPSPWDGRTGGNQACLNSDVVTRFTTRISPATVSASSFVVRQCANAEDTCENGQIVQPAQGFPRVESSNETQDLVRFRPQAGQFAPGTRYKVFLTTGIATPGRLAMQERAACGAGMGYCFSFTTQSQDELCEVGQVLINPGTYRFDDIDETSDYHANPLAANDVCIQLNPEGMPWRWSTVTAQGRPDSRVEVSQRLVQGGVQSPDQIATARVATPDNDPAYVQALLAQRPRDVYGRGEAFVSLAPPRVEASGPRCDAACTNAAIWARFSTAMDPLTLTTSNITVRPCQDAECEQVEEPLSIARITVSAAPGLVNDARLRFVTIYANGLRAGQYYQVLLRSLGEEGIRSSRNLPLASLNHPQGYAWNFRVKTGENAECAAERVEVAPAEKIESVIGARQAFMGFPYSAADTCSDSGQLLMSTQPYAWSTVDNGGQPDATVARLLVPTQDGADINDPELRTRVGSSATDRQLAEIIASRDPGTGESTVVTNVRASYQSRSGLARYGLQCGFREESACPSGTGLTAGGCCAPRPTVDNRFPVGSNVCRNTLIYADFNVPLDMASVASSSNIVVAREVRGASVCPVGTQVIALGDQMESSSFFARLWSRVIRLFTPERAMADVWCAGDVLIRTTVLPQGNGSRVQIAIQSALEANTRYRVILRGTRDFTSPTDVGIRSERGVRFAAEQSHWVFQTGSTICAARTLAVDDTNAESPFLFTRHPEGHVYQATVHALNNEGQAVPIVPVSQYMWRFGPWASSQTTILQVTRVPEATDGDRANVTTQNKNGNSFISARIEITNDAVSTPSSTGRVIETARSSNVLLCERPWPSREIGPLSDSAGSRSLRELAPIFASGPFYNFSTLYCRDDDTPGEAGDLPEMRLNPVPLNSADRALGIERQYLFTFTDPASRGDGIGIRLASNPLHMPLKTWYASRGFSGQPSDLMVDGYEAIKDGNTIYVSPSNAENGTVRSTIFIISRNPDAKPATVNIFDQLVKNLAFNVNLVEQNSNACVQLSGNLATENNATIACTADWECAAKNISYRCASVKAKLQRDRQRLGDFQVMMSQLERVKTREGKYPKIETGSFIPGMSTSRWSSWSTAFADMTSLPQDPVNKYISCGRCKNATTNQLGRVCTETSECGQGESCVGEMGDLGTSGFDPATCWNATTERYLCPTIIERGVAQRVLQQSYLYQYRALDSGNRYELATNFEAMPGSAYRPALQGEIRRCVGRDIACTSNSDCDIRNVDGSVRTPGTCAGTGGQWVYDGAAFCKNNQYFAATACNENGVGQGQACRIGQTRMTPCLLPGNVQGTRLQTCNATCTDYVDAPQSACVPAVQCGNGRVDTGETCDDGAALNGQYGYCDRTCQSRVGYCGDGVIGGGETCDNGAPMSTPPGGRMGTNGQYCGLGCDTSLTCGMDCRSLAPRCGDGRIDEPNERCDGQGQVTTQGICHFGPLPSDILQRAPEIRRRQPLEVPCTRDSDCATGGRCAPADQPNYASCQGVTVRQCAGGATSGRCVGGINAGNTCRVGENECGSGSCQSITCTTNTDCGERGQCLTYATQRVRSCGTPGAGNQCQFSSWSVCTAIGQCGDGTVNPGEQCDDGGEMNLGSGRCTPQCQLNRCGDGYFNAAQEECDFGARNGTTPVAVEYGTTGVMCSNQCRIVSVSGGYCGNNRREFGEMCDGPDILPNFTCESIGAYPIAREGALTCNQRCEVQGCRSCSDRLPEGQGISISGRVFDAVLLNIPLPTAVVTLRNNGIRVNETRTDGAGRFTFAGLHGDSSCSNYSITVSLSQNLDRVNSTDQNPVLLPVEGGNDGYFTYTSGRFSVTTFHQVIRSDQGNIYLMPHVGDNETLVVRQWDNGPGSTNDRGQFMDPQLVLPRLMGYTTVNPASRCEVPMTGANDSCQRSINWSSADATGVPGTIDRRGNRNLSIAPHARLYCYQADGTSNCTGEESEVESVFYRRTDPTDGTYRYFLVDGRWSDGERIQDQGLRNLIRVLWRDESGREQYAEFTPPPITPETTACGVYWYAFDQDPRSGQIRPVNRMMCNASSFTDDDTRLGIGQILMDNGEGS